MKKILLLVAAACSFVFTSTAQNMLDYNQSNYSGVNSVLTNPAFIADSRFKCDINLFSFGFMFQNNYVGMNKSAFNHDGFTLMEAIRDTSGKAFPAFNDSLFQQHYLHTRDNDDKKSVFLNNRILLPLSFMVSLNQKSSLAVTGEFRTMMNVDGVETPMAQLAYAGLNDPSLWTKQFTNDHLSIQFMSWHEIGVDYARVVMDKQTNFLKVGIRPKLLLGLGSAYLYADNLSYLTVNNDTLSLFKSHIQYSHSKNFDLAPPGSQGNLGPFSNIFSGIAGHPSIGLDIGAVYEWRPDYKDYKYDMDGETDLWKRSKNKYKLRVALSVTDIGSIKFDRGQLSNNFYADVSLWNVHDLDFSGDTSNGNPYEGPIQAWDDTLHNRFKSEPTDPSYKMNLPLAFRSDVDYQIWKDFYVNLGGVYAVQWRKNPNKVHDLSGVAITPRWDYKWFGVLVPFSYNQYRNFAIGTCLRMGPLVFGTSNLAPYFSKKKDIYGLDFYFGIKVPIHYKEPKDKDKDKVSNKKDKCVDVPGVWEFMGCPDRDGDHVQDSEDLCPDTPGLKQFNGCPDRDGDGIVDGQDACPDDPGLAKFNGCPDKDGDGIIDKDDDCPDEAGLAQFKGCPDRDGDGVMDKIDVCPDKPGPVENEGCPEIKLSLVDLAGQSLKTSTQAKDGSFTFESLPNDSICVFRLDGDPDKTIGVNEVKVIVNGAAKRAIRSQADGLFRFDIPKPVGNGLKPVEVKDVTVVLTKEEQEVVKKAFDNLEFETGKDIIRPSSYAALDELAALMIKHPTWGLKISGHTDNVGKPAANLTLSKKRAEAVKKYLVAKGVSADHLRSEWYGQTKPIAPNTTEAGRQKNRRVEMLIIDYFKGMDVWEGATPAKPATAPKPKPKTPVKPK
jgi:outer membrane protein OmpA-like peptidoglycan-associated protein